MAEGVRDGGRRRWVVERVPELRGYAVEWVSDRETILSSRRRLYRAPPGPLRPPFAPIGAAPHALWRRVAARARRSSDLKR